MNTGKEKENIRVGRMKSRFQEGLEVGQIEAKTPVGVDVVSQLY